MPSRSLGAVVIKKEDARLRRDAVYGVAAFAFRSKRRLVEAGGVEPPSETK